MAETSSSSLDDKYRVGSLPTLYLIPDYISSTLEQSLSTNILATRQSWTHVNGRTLQNQGGAISSKGGLIPAPMPSWLQSVVDDVSNNPIGLFGDAPANHVLINRYEKDQGIFPHEDGPLYYPVVAILSLNSPALIRFKARTTHDAEVIEKNRESGGVAVVVPPRSLLIFKDDAYSECLHGIDSTEEEVLDASVVNPEAAVDAERPAVLKRTGTRISLTIRRVIKVHKLGFFKK